MLYNYNAYETYNVEYSLNGTDWTKVGAIKMPGAKAWTDGEFTLPADANNKAEVYIRWIADKTSSIKGATGDQRRNLNHRYLHHRYCPARKRRQGSCTRKHQYQQKAQPTHLPTVRLY